MSKHSSLKFKDCSKRDKGLHKGQIGSRKRKGLNQEARREMQRKAAANQGVAVARLQNQKYQKAKTESARVRIEYFIKKSVFGFRGVRNCRN